MQISKISTHLCTKGQNQPDQSFRGWGLEWAAAVFAARPEVCGCRVVSTEPMVFVLAGRRQEWYGGSLLIMSLLFIDRREW